VVLPPSLLSSFRGASLLLPGLVFFFFFFAICDRAIDHGAGDPLVFFLLNGRPRGRERTTSSASSSSSSLLPLPEEESRLSGFLHCFS